MHHRVVNPLKVGANSHYFLLMCKLSWSSASCQQITSPVVDPQESSTRCSKFCTSFSSSCSKATAYNHRILGKSNRRSQRHDMRSSEKALSDMTGPSLKVPSHDAATDRIHRIDYVIGHCLRRIAREQLRRWSNGIAKTKFSYLGLC